MSSPSDVEIAWAAGLFEGEGCLSTNGKPGMYGRQSARACLMMADEDVVRRFARIVGVGRIYEQKVRRPSGRDLTYWTTTRGSEFEIVVELFRPWLGQRRLARAAELLHNARLPVGKTNCRTGKRGVLKPEDVRHIRTSRESGVVLAQKYGVSQSTVSLVRTGVTWTHIH